MKFLVSLLVSLGSISAMAFNQEMSVKMENRLKDMQAAGVLGDFEGSDPTLYDLKAQKNLYAIATQMRILLKASGHSNFYEISHSRRDLILQRATVVNFLCMIARKKKCASFQRAADVLIDNGVFPRELKREYILSLQ